MFPFGSILDVLLLIKKRAPAAPPKMADVSAEEKVNYSFKTISCHLGKVHSIGNTLWIYG